MVNHIVELVVPWALLLGRRQRCFAGAVQVRAPAACRNLCRNLCSEKTGQSVPVPRRIDDRTRHEEVGVHVSCDRIGTLFMLVTKIFGVVL